MSITQEHRLFSIDTPLGQDVLVFYRMTGMEQLGRLFEYDIELLSERPDIDLADLLGKNVTLTMQLPEAQVWETPDDWFQAPTPKTRSGGTRYFNGFVTRFSYPGMLGRYHLYRATLSPWLWFLTRTADCRIFQQQTTPQIIKQVFQQHGFSDFKETLSGHYRTFDYCVQYRETDFDFVSRLMEQEGIYYYFKHDKDKHILVLADDYSSHGPFPHYAETPYYPPDAMHWKERDHLYEWTMQKQVQAGRYELSDFDFTAPNKNLRKARAIPGNHAHAGFRIYDYPGDYREFADGENYVKIRLQELLAQHEILQGRGVARGLATGYLFTLTNFGRAEQNRQYLIVAAEYALQSDAYQSTPEPDSLDQPFEVRITAIDARQPYRAPRITLKPSVRGPQTAMVVGPEGQDIWTDEYGRVKIQFHWDQYGEKNENSSCWVRVAQLWTGQNWGAVAIPRIGQEVIVDFLEGNPDHPIITGQVYNGRSKPPYALPEHQTQTGIKTHSTPGGGGFNELRFEDKKGEEQLSIYAQRNQDITVGNDETHEVGHDRTKTVHGNETSNIGCHRTETVAGNESVSITGNRTEAVKGDETLTIQGNREESVAGNESVSITGNRTETLGGSQTETITGSLTQTITGNVNITTPGSMTVTANGGYTLIAPGGTRTIDNYFDSWGGSKTSSFGTLTNINKLNFMITGLLCYIHRSTEIKTNLYSKHLAAVSSVNHVLSISRHGFVSKNSPTEIKMSGIFMVI
ncbi:MAG: type VI secretion system tip protein VgrG [Candidatus Competibacteraceae bacterium]|nr:type VI secretion system tip protein VgrG [Candidatus Competibacteraceae bacterium]